MVIKNSHHPCRSIALLALVITLLLGITSCSIICRWCEERAPDKGIELLDDKGMQTDRIDALDNLRVHVSGLKPGTRYTLRVVDGDGRQIATSTLAADRRGNIRPFTLLYGENLFVCRDALASLETDIARLLAPVEKPERVSESEVLARFAEMIQSMQDRRYFLEVVEGKRVIRRTDFLMLDDDKPKIYVADQRGCMRGGFIQGKDDVYAVGRNFPPGSTVYLFVVPDQRRWRVGDQIKDITGLGGGPDPVQVRLGRDKTDFFVKIWSRRETTTGLYDLIARYTASERPTLDPEDIVAADVDVGFLIQRDSSDPHIEQNMTVPAVDGVLYYMFQDKYFNNEDVWVAVNPKDRPGGISGAAQNAYVYVVDHLSESQWAHGTQLTDKSGNGPEFVSIKGSCRNANEFLVWEAPLTNGNYDVVVDFAPFGFYDQGQDIVDELDNVGFMVVNPTAFAIVYPVNPLRVYPGREVPTGLKKDYIYAVAKIDPATSGTNIYWDSFDIDDPSSDAAPVDPNGASGDDNRGNHGAAPGAPDGDDGKLQGENSSGVATTITYSNGIAFVPFYVTMQPGDNFRLRASTSSGFASFDESAPITVWRRLHVEVDDMGPPIGNVETGTITNVNYNAGTNTSVVSVSPGGLDDGAAGSTGGRFENGILTAGGNTYPVISNTSTTVTVQGQPPNSGSFTLVDDDVMPADVLPPDIGDMVRAYGRAFILPVFDTGQNTSNVTFDLNSTEAEILALIQNNKGTPFSTEDYWTVTVLGGFQLPEDEDNDPDDEGTWRAGAADMVQGVFTGNECIRNWIQAPAAAGGAGGVDPDVTGDLPRSPRRQEILVHEVGHLLSLMHADGAPTAANPNGGVMRPSCCPANTRQSSNFTDQSLHKLRSIAEPD